MNKEAVRNQGKGPLEALAAWFAEEDGIRLSILSTFLDAHFLFGEMGLSAETLQSLFTVWWPDTSLAETLTELVASGSMTAMTDASYAVHPELRHALAAKLEGYLVHYPLDLPEGRTGLEELLNGFADYLEREVRAAQTPAHLVPEVWGGRAFAVAGRSHIILLRPFLLRLQALPDAYMLVLCHLPEAGIETITEHFVRVPALRQRLALYDLETGYKISLVRSDVFVYFERYLQRVHGRRIVPIPAFTQSLMDSGLLSLRKG